METPVVRHKYLEIYATFKTAINYITKRTIHVQKNIQTNIQNQREREKGLTRSIDRSPWTEAQDLRGKESSFKDHLSIMVGQILDRMLFQRAVLQQRRPT